MAQGDIGIDYGVVPSEAFMLRRKWEWRSSLRVVGLW